MRPNTFNRHLVYLQPDVEAFLFEQYPTLDSRLFDEIINELVRNSSAYKKWSIKNTEKKAFNMKRNQLMQQLLMRKRLMPEE